MEDAIIQTVKLSSGKLISVGDYLTVSIKDQILSCLKITSIHFKREFDSLNKVVHTPCFIADLCTCSIDDPEEYEEYMVTPDNILYVASSSLCSSHFKLLNYSRVLLKKMYKHNLMQHNILSNDEVSFFKIHELKTERILIQKELKRLKNDYIEMQKSQQYLYDKANPRITFD